MVKPPRTMQPEAIGDLDKAGRAKTKSFGQDSFHNYMARKISMQRQQFGLVVPPPPPPSEVDDGLGSIPAEQSSPPSSLLRTNNHQDSTPKSREEKTNPSPTRVRFAPGSKSVSSSFPDGDQNDHRLSSKRKRQKEGDLVSILRRLRRRHGKSDRKRRRSTADSVEPKQQQQLTHSETLTAVLRVSLENGQRMARLGTRETTDDLLGDTTIVAVSPPATKTYPKNGKLVRPDLFFSGVVVMVNGDTNPDAETLQRLLHRHGGDLEKYETSRITHIIAEHLSFAKAKMYKQQRSPRPVVYPRWILDSVAQQRLLPTSNYLLKEFRRDEQIGQKSVREFFQTNKTTVPPVSSSPSSSPLSHLYFTSEYNSPSEPFRFRKRASDSFHYPSGKTQPDEGEDIPSSLEETPPLQIDFDELLQSERKPSRDEPIAFHMPNMLEPVLEESFGTRHLPSDTLMENGRSPEGIGGGYGNDMVDIKQAIQLEKFSQQQEEGGHLQGQLETSSPFGSKMDPRAVTSHKSRTDDKYINGQIRTVGTDPNFLVSFFRNSRLSYIGSFKQRRTNRPINKNKTARGDGKRFVFHIDLDCFFAAVVLRKFPQYRNLPVAISHQGKSFSGINAGSETGESFKNSTSECATCNYEARKYGVKKGMYLGKAKELCPNLVVLAYDFEGYKEVSSIVGDILHEVSAEHGGIVEEVSCDESYMELQLGSESEASVIAEHVRKEILKATDCTATVGVADNKFLAKLATDHVKPNRSFVVHDKQELLRPLNLRDLHGIGYRSEPKLAQIGLVTVEDVWRRRDRCIDDLKEILGDQLGKKIWMFCQGKDDRPVECAERKTIGAECNYGVRFDGPYGVDHMILGLAKEVEHRMESVGVKGTKVTLKVKRKKPGAPPPPKFLGHGSCFNLSKSMDSAQPTRDRSTLSKIGLQLFSQLKIPKEEVRGMGLVVSSLTEDGVSTSGVSTTVGIDKYFQKVAPDTCFQKDSTERKSPQISETKQTDIEKAVNETFEVDDSSVELIEAEAADTFDIDLPALSQIDMSQVEQLPASIRKKVTRKIEQQKAQAQKRETSKPKRDQPTVESMFQLATIKARGQSLPGMEPIDLRMSQFEHLPLDIQLELAGERMDRKPAARKLQLGTKTDGTMKKRQPTTNPAVNAFDGGRSIPPLAADEKDFFHENVLPLSIFLDENPPSAASQDLVASFFDQIVEGSLLADVLVLLRSIKNRGDSWSEQPCQSVMQAVNRKVIESYGMPLDLNF